MFSNDIYAALSHSCIDELWLICIEMISDLADQSNSLTFTTAIACLRAAMQMLRIPGPLASNAKRRKMKLSAQNSEMRVEVLSGVQALSASITSKIMETWASTHENELADHFRELCEIAWPQQPPVPSLEGFQSPQLASQQVIITCIAGRNESVIRLLSGELIKCLIVGDDTLIECLVDVHEMCTSMQDQIETEIISNANDIRPFIGIIRSATAISSVNEQITKFMLCGLTQLEKKKLFNKIDILKTRIETSLYSDLELMRAVD